MDTFYALMVEENGGYVPVLDEEGAPRISLDAKKAMEMRDQTDCPEAVFIFYCERFA